MTAVVIWADDEDRVVALTPPGGLTVAEAKAAMAPKDRDSFVVDSATLPDAPMSAWRLGKDGVVTVDEAASLKARTPATASAGNFVHALYDLEWLSDVKAAVTAADGLADELWRHAPTFERDDPLMLQIATAIGKTADDLDTLFRKAATYD